MATMFTRMYTESIKVAADAIERNSPTVAIGSDLLASISAIDDALWAIAEALEDSDV